MANGYLTVRNVVLIILLFVNPLPGFSLDFGRVRVTEVQVDTVSIQNTDLVDLMIIGHTASPPIFTFAPAAFTGDVVRIRPGETGQIPVVFAPQSLGKVSGQISIETNLKAHAWDLGGIGVEEVVVINEVLADPPAGLSGDANGDGLRSSNEDEFVELLNTGNYPIDLGGWQVFDAGASLNNRFSFPEGASIEPSERIVIFGGGHPQGLSGQVFTDDGKIGGGLRNSGDKVFLFNPVTGDTIAKMTYGVDGGRNQSLVRSPEGTGNWQQHAEVSLLQETFSPGLATNPVGLEPQWVALRASVTDSLVLVGDSILVSIQGIAGDGNTTVLPSGYTITHNDTLVSKQTEGVFVAQRVGAAKFRVDFNELKAEAIVRIVEQGDLNYDGFYTLWDAIRAVHLILNIATDENGFDRRSADLNGDGALDIRDLMALIQHILGGPLVAGKFAEGGGLIGWEHTKDGVLLFVPASTRVITFEIRGYTKELALASGFGDFLIQNNGGDQMGILIIQEEGELLASPRKIHIRGVPRAIEGVWSAWTLDGKNYPLDFLDQGNKRVNLVQVSPNPFNPSTAITYSVKSPQVVALSLFNVTGQLVRELFIGHVLPGVHTVVWDAQDALGRPVASGVYFAALRGETSQTVLKLMVLR